MSLGPAPSAALGEWGQIGIIPEEEKAMLPLCVAFKSRRFGQRMICSFSKHYRSSAKILNQLVDCIWIIWDCIWDCIYGWHIWSATYSIPLLLHLPTIYQFLTSVWPATDIWRGTNIILRQLCRQEQQIPLCRQLSCWIHLFFWFLIYNS